VYRREEELTFGMPPRKTKHNEWIRSTTKTRRNKEMPELITQLLPDGSIRGGKGVGGGKTSRTGTVKDGRHLGRARFA